MGAKENALQVLQVLAQESATHAPRPLQAQATVSLVHYEVPEAQARQSRLRSVQRGVHEARLVDEQSVEDVCYLHL